jgi:hypothetical protein
MPRETKLDQHSAHQQTARTAHTVSREVGHLENELGGRRSGLRRWGTSKASSAAAAPISGGGAPRKQARRPPRRSREVACHISSEAALLKMALRSEVLVFLPRRRSRLPAAYALEVASAKPRIVCLRRTLRGCDFATSAPSAAARRRRSGGNNVATSKTTCLSRGLARVRKPPPPLLKPA